MSNFSFSYIVFKKLIQQTRKNQGLFGKGLKYYLLLKIQISDPYKMIFKWKLVSSQQEKWFNFS